MKEPVQNENENEKTYRLIKYNCFKHLAELYEIKSDYQKAFECIYDACELDDSDVLEMSKWGEIALQQKQYSISNFYFGKALKQNPKHWPSLFGTLKLLCSEKNFFEAYGWALHILQTYPNEQHAIDVLFDVREQLGSLTYLEKYIFTSFEISSSNH